MAFSEYINDNLQCFDTRESSTAILNALNKIVRENSRNVKLTQNQQCALHFFEVIISSLNHVGLYGMFKTHYNRETVCPACGKCSEKGDITQYVNIFKSSQIPNYHNDKMYATQPKILLDYLGHREVISSWVCPDCSVESHDVTSVVKMIVPAKIIVFVFDKAMDNSSVILPPSMKIRGRIKGEEFHLSYHPVSVIQHYGTTKSGHYIANCLRLSHSGDMKWYRCNDDLVHELADDPLSGANIFMAFYAMDE